MSCYQMLTEVLLSPLRTPYIYPHASFVSLTLLSFCYGEKAYSQRSSREQWRRSGSIYNLRSKSGTDQNENRCGISGN
ncbi:unnamed protein product [Dicrocoelium dendriticum]|nr:unnamed protein product [Dicrocoelium dendriticum]